MADDRVQRFCQQVGGAGGRHANGMPGTLPATTRLPCFQVLYIRATTGNLSPRMMRAAAAADLLGCAPHHPDGLSHRPLVAPSPPAPSCSAASCTTFTASTACCAHAGTQGAGVQAGTAVGGSGALRRAATPTHGRAAHRCWLPLVHSSRLGPLCAGSTWRGMQSVAGCAVRVSVRQLKLWRALRLRVGAAVAVPASCGAWCWGTTVPSLPQHGRCRSALTGLLLHDCPPPRCTSPAHPCTAVAPDQRQPAAQPGQRAERQQPPAPLALAGSASAADAAPPAS